MDKDKKNIKSLQIVSIDPISLKSYIYNKNKIHPKDLTKANTKKEFYITFIDTKHIISGVVELSKEVGKEDLDHAIELEAYGSLELDPAIEYKIIHSQIDTKNVENKLFNVFALDVNLIKNNFQKISSKTKYIDHIAAAPFLISALYEKKMLQSNGVDCFIYFQKHDAFFVAYRNGKYLYSKSLNYSLLQIKEKFCKLLGQKIDDDTFFTMLTNEGLNTLDIAWKQNLMELFGDIFLHINDIVIFFKGSCQIENINNIYLGSTIGDISGMIEYSQNYLGIETKRFNFNIAENTKEFYLDQMHILMILTAQIYQENQNDHLNLSIFKRPPTFFKRPSGIISSIIILSLLISLSYPAYQFGYGSYLNFKTSLKENEYKKVHSSAQKMHNTISGLENKKTIALKTLKKERKNLQFREKILNEIYDKKVKYPMKASILNDLSKLINKRGIKISSLNLKDKQVMICLRSKSDRQLTMLLEDISKTKSYKISTKEIRKIENINLYESNVTIGVLD
ncbi:MAG: hypothetical protein CR967_01705 [Proteobacteria bacterium]|nr:MAG: hypothetical protein CR967_01705 [Pseudomonadota bacterium]